VRVNLQVVIFCGLKMDSSKRSAYLHHPSYVTASITVLAPYHAQHSLHRPWMGCRGFLSCIFKSFSLGKIVYSLPLEHYEWLFGTVIKKEWGQKR